MDARRTRCLSGQSAPESAGVRMIFGGLPSPTDRANLIAYLATLK
jgi:cytochrome c2